MTDNGNLIMPVAPAYNNGGGFGFGGDNGWWILLLLLFAGGGFGFGGYGGADMYPWMNQANMTSNGFQNALLNDSVTSIRDGVSDISSQLCSGFAGVEQGANTRQMADMQTAFAAQSAMNQGFNSLQAQLAQCCCDNRLATCQTQNVIQSEASATRFADANNTRDIMENCNRNNQAILDKLCQLELDAKNDKINDLERQLTMASLKASQVAQTAQLVADNTAQTQYIVNRVAPYPIPSYTVPNPFTPTI